MKAEIYIEKYKLNDEKFYVLAIKQEDGYSAELEISSKQYKFLESAGIAKIGEKK